MAAIVELAASIDGIPTLEETDAMLEELCQLPRDTKTSELIDSLLEIRVLLGAT